VVHCFKIITVLF